MSGIAGIIHFDGRPVEPGLIEKMTGAMAHRGPDGIHHWVKGSVALGQCMLRTTPESLEEHQPLTNEDESLVLVMDGRVDNWEELRRELLGRGAVLRTRADAELVLRAYEVWGRDCLAHIDGDFALVIWDARRREAFCARDRMGHKPFHYHWNGNTFIFASDLHSILTLSWVKQQPNEGLLAEALAWEWYSRDETLWSGVLRLVAAHQLVAGKLGLRPEAYWEPSLSETLNFRKDEEYIDHYRELLFDSVRRSSRSHQPVAIDVSGGLDSSAVFCVAEHLRRENDLPAPSIEGYTLAFVEDCDANEIAYARSVGDYLGVRIHEIPPSRMRLSWYAERARADRQLPGFPNGAMQVGLWRRATEQGCRVTLSGIGGDQWLQGSRVYYAEALAQWHWPKLLDCFSIDAKGFGNRQAASWLLRQGLFPLLPIAFQEGLRRLVRPRRAEDSRASVFWLSPRLRTKLIRRRSDSPQHWRVRSISHSRLYDYLYDAFGAYAREDIERLCAQECGIEMRCPLNDHRLAQYAFSTPEWLRLRGNRTKYMHVQALRDLMPKAILERRSKAEFSIVYRNLLDSMHELLTQTLPLERPNWINQDGMVRLFGAYKDNRQSGWPLWVLWSINGCDQAFARD